MKKKAKIKIRNNLKNKEKKQKFSKNLQKEFNKSKTEGNMIQTCRRYGNSNNYQSNVSSVSSIYGSYRYSSCHDPKEIIPNLFLGSKSNIKFFVEEGVDVLIPLDSLSGAIWDYDFQGEIYYFPIEDFSILPEYAEEKLLLKIDEFISEGKKVAVFCFGGHGRTGYVAALYLAYIGYKDPIKYIRDNYCSKAIESQSQIDSIAEFIGNPELSKKYKIVDVWGSGGWYGYPYYSYGSHNYNSTQNNKKEEKNDQNDEPKSSYVNIGGQIQKVGGEDDEELEMEELEKELEEIKELDEEPEDDFYKSLTETEKEYYNAFYDYYGREPYDHNELYEGFWLKQFNSKW